MKLGSKYKLPKFVITLVMAFCFVAFMGGASVTTAMGSGKEGLKSRKVMVDKLLKVTGTEKTAYKMDSLFFGDQLAQSLPRQGSIIMLKNMMKRVYEPEEWLQSIRLQMMKNYQSQHMQILLKWYQSPLGQRIVQEGMVDLEEGMTEDKKRFLEQLTYYPPKENRLEMAERFETSVGMTDYIMDTSLVFIKVLLPFIDKSKGQSVRDVSANIREELFDPARENFLKSFLYMVRNLSDKELSQYVSFVSSPAGKWIYRSHFRGSRDGLEQMSLEMKKLLNQIQEEIQRDGKSDLLKEIAPPGQRFAFIKLRDPFTPLVDPKQGFIQPDEEDATEMEFRKFADELKNLPQIPLEVYRNIKKTDPRLYADLEHFGGLFSQESKIASLGEDDYLNTVNKYKDLIQKANDTQPGMIITPIQADYEKLKLVGVIWKNNETIALVETGDSKGHSVKEGDLLGPNFGVVEVIDNNQMMILEQSRDYLGNILSKKKQLEIINEGAEEG